MKSMFLLAPAFLLVAATGPELMRPRVEPSPRFDSAAEAARAVSGGDGGASRAAVAYLRGLGVAGLEALKSEYADEVSWRLGEGDSPGHTPETSARILKALDAVSGQHDGWASGLYWHTDRATALADARESGLPILNLWLLGRLDDEFC